MPATGGEPVAWRRAGPRPEPARASLLVRRNSWSQLVATSRQAARRDEHPRGLRPARRLRCCGGTAEQVRAAVAGPWLGHRPTPRTLANRCSSRRRGAFKYEKQQRLNRSEIRFARDGRTENCTQRKEAKENRSTNQTPCGRDNAKLCGRSKKKPLQLRSTHADVGRRGPARAGRVDASPSRQLDQKST